MSIRAAEGKRITRVYGPNWLKCTEVDLVVPDGSHLMNFHVRGDGLDMVVLDPYGDELDSTVRAHIFGKSPQWTLGIDRRTGDIRIVTHHEDDDGVLALFFYGWMSDGERPVQYRIPRRYRARLPELLSKKRPYRCHIHPLALEMFAIQEWGWERLRSEVVFLFDFDGDALEVWGESYRRVSNWK